MLLLVMRVTNDYSQNDDDDDRNHAGRRTMMTTLMKLMLMRDPVNKAREHELDFCSNLRLYYTQRQIILTSSTLFCVPKWPILPTNSDLHSCTMLHNSFQSSKLRFLSIVQTEVLYVPHLSPNSVLWGLSEHISSTPRSMHSARERPQRPKLPKWRSPDGVRHRGRLCGCLYTTCDSMSEVAKIPTRGGCIFAICMLLMWKIKCTNCSCVLWGSLLLSLSFRLGLLAKSTWYCFAIQNDVTCWYGAVLCAFEALLAKPSAPEVQVLKPMP